MHTNIFTNKIQCIMKMKSKTKSCCQYTQWVVLALLTLIFASCKDNDDATGDFDPNKPVVISEFSPKEGGLGTLNALVWRKLRK